MPSPEQEALEAIASLRNHEGWLELVKRYELEISELRAAALDELHTTEDLTRAKAWLSAIQEILAVPEEARNQLDEQE